MMARLISVSPQLQLSVRFWLNAPQVQSSQEQYSFWKKAPRKSFFEHDASEKFQAPDEVGQDSFWRSIIESLPNGVLVLSQSLDPLYWTDRARCLCKRLRKPHEQDEGLPSALTEFCQKFLKEEGKNPEPLLMEYRGDDGHLIRAQVQWIPFGSCGAQSCLMVLLEDCSATLLEEHNLEQKKYELTDREAEVWILLRQEYSYQEISTLLNISLNTVKTHVKKVYAKRRNLVGSQKVWYSR